MSIVQICRIAVYVGSISTAIFLISSLILLFGGISKEWGLTLIGFVPFTFLLTFAGLVIVILGSPRETNEGRDAMTAADLHDDPQDLEDHDARKN